MHESKIKNDNINDGRERYNMTSGVGERERERERGRNKTTKKDIEEKG